MSDSKKKPIGYILAVAAIVCGGIFAVCGGFYGFGSLAGGWIEAGVGLGAAALGALLLFWGLYALDAYSQTEEENNVRDYRDKAQIHAARNVFLTLGGTGVGGALVVIVHLIAAFSWGNLLRAGICLGLTAALLTLGVIFKKKYEKL